MIGLLPLLVVALASYRLTRVVTTDTISEAARARVYRWAWDDDAPERTEGGELVPSPRAPWRTYVYELVTCAWCAGFWISAGTYAAWRAEVEWLRVGVVVFAVAGLQGFIASRRDA